MAGYMGHRCQGLPARHSDDARENFNEVEKGLTRLTAWVLDARDFLEAQCRSEVEGYEKDARECIAANERLMERVRALENQQVVDETHSAELSKLVGELKSELEISKKSLTESDGRVAELEEKLAEAEKNAGTWKQSVTTMEQRIVQATAECDAAWVKKLEGEKGRWEAEAKAKLEEVQKAAAEALQQRLDAREVEWKVETTNQTRKAHEEGLRDGQQGESGSLTKAEVEELVKDAREEGIVLGQNELFEVGVKLGFVNAEEFYRLEEEEVKKNSRDPTWGRALGDGASSSRAGVPDVRHSLLESLPRPAANAPGFVVASTRVCPPPPPVPRPIVGAGHGQLPAPPEARPEGLGIAPPVVSGRRSLQRRGRRGVVGEAGVTGESLLEMEKVGVLYLFSFVLDIL